MAIFNIRGELMIELLPVVRQAQTTGAYWGRLHAYTVTCVTTNRLPFDPVCYPYHSSGVSVIFILLGLNNNVNTYILGYWGSLIGHTNGHKYTHCLYFVRLVLSLACILGVGGD